MSYPSPCHRVDLSTFLFHTSVAGFQLGSLIMRVASSMSKGNMYGWLSWLGCRIIIFICIWALICRLVSWTVATWKARSQLPFATVQGSQISPGEELLVIFMDGVPRPSVIQAFLGAAAQPQNLRFMYFTSSEWSITHLEATRPRGTVTEKYIVATICAADPVPHFDNITRDMLKSSAENCIYSHSAVESMKIHNSRYLPVHLKRCVVPAQVSKWRQTVSFSLPDRRFLCMTLDCIFILEMWANDLACDIAMADVCYNADIGIVPCSKCVLTIAPGSNHIETICDASLRLRLITGAFLTGKDAAYVNVASDLSLVYVT